jgi:hypothetical protein
MSLTHETYTYTLHGDRGVIVWDVSRAQALLAREGGLATIEVDREQQAHVATTYDITEEKVARADIAQPGIAAPIIWDGDPTLGPHGILYVLIDGIHRTHGQDRLCWLMPDSQFPPPRECASP